MVVCFFKWILVSGLDAFIIRFSDALGLDWLAEGNIQVQLQVVDIWW